MKQLILVVALGCLLGALLLGLARQPKPATPDPEPAAKAVLVFSKTAGFRHDSIPDGINAVRRLGAKNNFHVTATEDSSLFTDASLARFHVVIFLNTTGDVLDDPQQAAFERFIRAGRGYVGIHSAADTEYDWPWYGKLVGAYFRTHPAVQPADLNVETREHPATRHLPLKWRRTDEWYDYRSNPRQNVHVLLSLDESSYRGGTMGDDHPIAWFHEFDGGRAFYTGLGHTRETFSEPDFLTHLLGGILWAMGE